ncbi:hypothetical protein G9A89_022113 [Geosiphon pyriformis]|nr:hypothetical protein G9A89_022113 [Geosiphon pyriformis]
MPQHFLCFLVMLPVNFLNCFLASATHVLTLCKTSLSSAFSNVFQTGTSVSILDVLGLDGYLDKKLDPRGPIPIWFVSVTNFVKSGGLGDNMSTKSCSALTKSSCDIYSMSEHLLASKCNSVEVYTDGSVKSLGSIGAYGSTAAYFLKADASISIKVFGLLFSTLVELQGIALVLECVPVSSTVELFTDS